MFNGIAGPYEPRMKRGLPCTARHPSGLAGGPRSFAVHHFGQGRRCGGWLLGSCHPTRVPRRDDFVVNSVPGSQASSSSVHSQISEFKGSYPLIKHFTIITLNGHKTLT